MNARSWTRPLAFIAAILLAGAIYLFITQEVLSALSNWAGGNIAWVHQLSYNMVHGRPFQLSVLHNGFEGINDNPSAYINGWAQHANLTHFLFTPVYTLFPSILTLYMTVFAVNYVGIGWLLRRIVLSSDAPDAQAKADVAVTALLLSSGFFWTVCCHAQPPLYLGPFFFAAHYFFLTRRIAAFWAAFALCCLVSEDSALFLIGWSGYLFLFYPERRRQAVAAGLAAAAWAYVYIAILSPAARFGSGAVAGSNFSGSLAWKLSKMTADANSPIHNTVELLRALSVFAPLPLFVAFACVDRPQRYLWRAVVLAFLAPATHWVITIMASGDHHWMPIFLCLLVLTTDMLCDPHSRVLLPLGRMHRGALACLACFVAVNGIGLYYDPLKRLAKQYVLPAAMGYPVPNWREVTRHHRAVIAAAEALPRDGTMTVLTSEDLTGFLADRKSLWDFPDYFSESQYLLLDKGTAAAYHWTPRLHSLSEEDRAILKQVFDGRQSINGRELERSVGGLAEQLVHRHGTHRIVFEDRDVMVLGRLKSMPFVEPRQSYGFSFLSNVFSRRS